MKYNFVAMIVVVAGLILTVAAPTQAFGSMLTVKKIEADFPVTDLENSAWKKAKRVEIAKYWDGSKAPNGRTFIARLLWSDDALYIRFDATQTEPLIISSKPEFSKKVIGLWERDVCEIFIAPDRTKPNKYFEFEIAPNGEWVDLGIEVTPTDRLTNWEYRSNMTSSARIDKDKVVMAIKIPFASLGRTPKKGDVWLGNLFRCVGKDPTRGYLAWQPTMTTEPAFHVPSKFGEFHFASN